MEPQNNNSKYYIYGLIALIIVALGVYVFRSDSPAPTESTDNETSSETEYVQTINVKHQYKNGTHTYVGAIDVPTPCHTLTSDVVKDASSAKNFTLAFTSSKDAKVMCAQVVTSKPFKVSFTGPQDSLVKATLNGKTLRFNIFEVPANQDLDSFDIYIKG